MPTQASSKPIDLQKVIADAAKLELKVLAAGVECMQVWINQAAGLSNIASETLVAIQADKGSVADTARRLTEFGKESAKAFGDLSSRLSKNFYDEIGRLTKAVEPDRPAGTARKSKAAKRRAPVMKTARKKPGRKKAAAKS